MPGGKRHYTPTVIHFLYEKEFVQYSKIKFKYQKKVITKVVFSVSAGDA